MNFWTKTEFEQFIVAVQDKPASYTAFMTLYSSPEMNSENAKEAGK